MLVGKPPFETSDVKTTYRKIRMNSYSFPDHISITPEAKSLISNILHLNPSYRLSLDKILSHEFFANSANIPKLLPASTLACAPSSSSLKQFTTRDTNSRDTRDTRDKPMSSRMEKPSNSEAFSKVIPNTERQPNRDMAKDYGTTDKYTERHSEKHIDKPYSLNSINPLTVRDTNETDKTNKEKGMRTLAVSL